MKRTNTASSLRPLVGVLVTLVGCLLASQIRLYAQNQVSSTGQTAIYPNQGNPINSQAVVDASTFYPAQGDICGVINYILSSSGEFNCGLNDSVGGVIDARGISPKVTGSGLQCTTNPFSTCGADANFAATVLLPAATIQAQATWVVPKESRIVGEGRNLTTIQACTTNNCPQSFSGSDVIEMCPSGDDCNDTGVEHLAVDAQLLSGVNGIHNPGSQELSFVRDVALNNVAGTGLLLDNTSGNSGPYSDIYFTGTGTCAHIVGNNTRGIHGLTCTGTGSATSAVLLDAPNNSLEDVYISGSYTNGILIGQNGAAQGNILLNINGGSSVGNVVTIANQHVSDLSILGVTTNATRGLANSIADNLTNTFLQDTYVGMYVVGEPVIANGGKIQAAYSRFTTSPSVPSWFVGNAAPSSSCSTGSLYSNTSGPANATLSACVNGGWKSVK